MFVFGKPEGNSLSHNLKMTGLQRKKDDKTQVILFLMISFHSEVKFEKQGMRYREREGSLWGGVCLASQGGYKEARGM